MMRNLIKICCHFIMYFKTYRPNVCFLDLTDLRLLSLRCKLYFDHLLRIRACSGKILFDHKNETLSITVSYFILLKLSHYAIIIAVIITSISGARTCIAKIEEIVFPSPKCVMLNCRMLLKTSQNKNFTAILYGQVARLYGINLESCLLLRIKIH